MGRFDRLQAYIDYLGAVGQAERQQSQMTLGQAIKDLEVLPPDATIQGLGKLHSYRGYYSDLAFEPDDTVKTVAEVLAECKKAMGRIYEGYKGGDYLMGENTPLWVSRWGEVSSMRLMDFDTEVEPIRPVLEEEDED